MKCVSYTRTIPWKNHKGELTIADQNQRIAEYLAEHKELNLQKRYSDRKNAENAGAAFDKMIDDGVEQKFDCIIVASMYYCGPDFPAARQAIKETLYETGVNLIVSKEQWYVAKNTHPAIIARDDFEKVQDILAKNQKVFKTVRAETEQIRTSIRMTLPEWYSVQTVADRWILIGFRMEQKKVKRFATIFAEQGRRMISASDIRLRKNF